MRSTNRILLCGFLCVGALFPTTRAAQPPRNVIVLLADDYGWMDMRANNPGTFYETPHLDELARRGVRFTSAYAANPVCSPTRYSILTGRYPTRAALTNWLPGIRNERFAGAPLVRQMPLDETTLAEVLRSAGYATAFVGKWHLGEKEEYWPESQGFDVNVGGWAKGHPPSYFSPYKNPRLTDGPPGEHLTERLAAESVRLLERFKAEGKPFFLYHCFYDVHTPLQAPAALVEKYRKKALELGFKDEFVEDRQYSISDKGPRRIRSVQSHAVYAAMVESMDTALGRIMTALDELGLTKDTLVIFTSDNGGLSSSEGHPTSNLPLRGGKGWVYEGGIRVPFIIARPEAAAASGSTSDVPVISMDIFPTALDFAGVPAPAGREIDGRSLLPWLQGKAEPPRGALYWHYPHYSNQGGFPGGAVREGDWKLVENYEDGSIALYNLRDDRAEQHDLAAAQPGRVRALRDKLHAWYRDTGARFLERLPDGPEPWRP